MLFDVVGPNWKQTIDGADAVEVGERAKSLVWVLLLSPLRFDYAVGLHFGLLQNKLIS